MDIILIVVKLTFLFIAIMLTSINITKVIYKDDISASNFFLMAVGVAGFITLQFDLWRL